MALEVRDEDLLRRVAGSDAAAMEALYDRFSGAIYSMGRAILRDAGAAEELVQEVFLTVWRSAPSFDARRGAARSWMLAMAHHRAIDMLRRRRLRQGPPIPPAQPSGELGPEAEALLLVQAEGVRAALADLPAPQREALVLAYFGGWTQSAISEHLGVPLGTIKTRIRDGLLRLRSRLGGVTP